MTTPAGQQHRPPSGLRTVVLVAIAGLVLVAAVAVAVYVVSLQKEQQAGAATLGGASLDPSTLPVIVPFRIVAGHIVIDAIPGDETSPMPFILDTGAPLLVSDAIAEAVGGTPAGSLATVAIDGTIEERDVVRLSRLRVGDVTFADVGAIRGFLDPGNPIACISEHGLIGASLMKEAVWQIDFDAQEVTIAADSAGLDHIDGAIALPFTSPSESSPSPRVAFAAGEGMLEFLVDTGSDAWLSVNPADLESVGIETLPGVPARSLIGAGASGSYRDRIEYVAVDLDIADRQFSGLPIATLGSLQAGLGNIGNDFLSHYIVTFDWHDMMMYLAPTDGAPEPSIPSSVTFTWDGDGVVVGSVVAGSQDGDAAVALGSSVEAINGVDVSDATFDEYCELAFEHANGAFALTVLSGTLATTVSSAPVSSFYDDLQP